ncbi:hypothetical protein ACIQ6R_14895 [Streptomyces sp. NPDC096048]|uniref:hypothetical protein n=1 Tax=Streptomyces sp. NPDC096048 TaxID=3366072 RepID=UPI00381914F2
MQGGSAQVRRQAVTPLLLTLQELARGPGLTPDADLCPQLAAGTALTAPSN